MYRILIVDDEHDVVDLTRKRLIKDGYEVYPAYNGQEAYQLTVKYVPDLIISDVLMPLMNGFEFCKAVRDNEKTKDIPIIIMTGNRSDMQDAFLFLGIKDILHKPFNLDQLEEKIKQHLGLAMHMHTQKTKLLLHCVRPAKMSAAKAVVESVPQWIPKFVTSGAELIARAKEFQPDVVVVDLFMNDMPADEAILCIKAMPELKSTEILTYYSPITEGDEYIIQARMIEIQYLKIATAAAGAKEYLGPLNNPTNFIAMFDDYRKDFA